jgi:hypothetical protein
MSALQWNWNNRVTTMDKEYVQYRANLAQKWERPIIRGLRQIEMAWGLPQISIETERNEWFTESWWIERHGVDPDALPLQLPICVIVGIRLNVEYRTGQHSFQALTRMGCDASSMTMIVKSFDKLQDALNFIINSGNQFQW